MQPVSLENSLVKITNLDLKTAKDMEKVTLGLLPFTTTQVRKTIFNGRDGTFESWKHRLLGRLQHLKERKLDNLS